MSEDYIFKKPVTVIYYELIIKLMKNNYYIR